MIRIAFVSVILIFVAFFTPAQAEKRVALVIGNAAYEHAPALVNPKNDADAMAALLADLGFEVVNGTDLDHAGMRQTILDFVYKLEGADVALFFYAGHGLQVHGRNYLAPVDAKLNREIDLDFRAMRLETVLAQMERAARVNLVFLDACRDNPLARNLARTMGTRSNAVGQGLAQVESGVGTLIAFATQPGNVALDGDTRHSPFTAALVKHIPTPGLDVALVMRKVRQEVIEKTGGAQVPWDNSSLTAPFIFKASAPAPVAAPAAQKEDVGHLERAFWRTAEELRTVAAYEDYLKRFPGGYFSTLARLRIAQLEMKEEPPVPAAERFPTDDTPPEVKTAARTESEAAPVESEIKPEAAPKPDTRELALALQKELARVGCDPGPADGDWGARSRAALRRFNQIAKLSLDTNLPTSRALEAVKNETVRVCPAPGQNRPAVRERTPKPPRPAVVRRSPPGSAPKQPVAREPDAFKTCLEEVGPSWCKW